MTTTSSDVALLCCVPLAREPLSPEHAAGVVPMLKAIADPARLRLLSLILSHDAGEACVDDLLAHFDLSQPTISHHLKVLHEAGLVNRDKRGTWVYYAARPEAMAALAGLFAPATASTRAQSWRAHRPEQHRPPDARRRQPAPGRRPSGQQQASR